MSKKLRGIQEAVAEALRELLAKVGAGVYGWGDDFDADSFCEDLSDIETVTQ